MGQSIAIAGLNFHDVNYDIPEQNKEGAPDILFAGEFSTNVHTLKFQYKSDEAITSFEVIKLNTLGQIIETITLSNSLISSDGIYHLCEGGQEYDEILRSGVYYFMVNGHYKSKNFQIFELLCPFIENEVFSNLYEDSIGELDFDITLLGASISTSVELTYTFSCGIASYSETLVLIPYPTAHNTTFAIPLGVSGNCMLTITNNVCSKIYTYNFEITPTSINCLDLEGGGVLELEAGGCLELEG